jgi:hypothetical protein
MKGLGIKYRTEFIYKLMYCYTKWEVTTGALKQVPQCVPVSPIGAVFCTTSPQNNPTDLKHKLF